MACVDFATPEDIYSLLWRRFNEADLDEQTPEARVATRYKYAHIAACTGPHLLIRYSSVIQIMSYWLNRRQFPVNAELLWNMREFCSEALKMVSSPTMVEKVYDLWNSIETLVSMILICLFQSV
jgi:hypothetical protein